MKNHSFSYEKITENFKHLALSPQDFKLLDKQNWVVLEKIHGANFSFILRENNLQFAKRKEIIGLEDDFFGFQLVVEKLGIPLQKLFLYLKNQYACKTCIVYGELFGGAYPHPQVKPDTSVQAIQTGVFYAPSIEFVVFDMALVDDNGQKTYFSYKEVMDLSQQFSILAIPPFHIGTLTEALNFDIYRPSIIPSLLGLPPLPQENLIEGIVIKPMNDFTLKADNETIRPILKIKNPRFKEDESYYQAQKWSFDWANKGSSDWLKILEDELSNLLNINRLNSAISKIGALDKNNQNRINITLQLVWEDILESFAEKFPNIWPDLAEKEQIQLKNKLELKILALIYQKN
jgi:Rnl2 family RNA ligase